VVWCWQPGLQEGNNSARGGPVSCQLRLPHSAPKGLGYYVSLCVKTNAHWTERTCSWCCFSNSSRHGSCCFIQAAVAQSSVSVEGILLYPLKTRALSLSSMGRIWLPTVNNHSTWLRKVLFVRVQATGAMRKCSKEINQKNVCQSRHLTLMHEAS